MVEWLTVSIDLDVRAAIRHPDLVRLVAAVVGADVHDEPDWLEWKSTLDLATKAGCFPIARTILGMANRQPESASRTCEGLGYIVVGAEPGNVEGVTTVDPANLDQMLEPWLGGGEGPRYTPSYVPFDGKTVLVVTVEAPQDGDPVYMLRKEFMLGKDVEKGRDGDVFVRKHGRTVPATSADQRALHARLVASPAVDAELVVSLVGDVPLSWYDAEGTGDVITAWVSERRARLEAAARAEEQRRHPEAQPTPPTGLAGTAGVAAFVQMEQMRRLTDTLRLASLAGVLGEADTRTLDQYLVEVDSWSERAMADAPAVLAARYMDARHGLVAVEVHNPTGRYLPKVEVEVHFEWEPLTTWRRRHDGGSMAPFPRPYGQPKPSPFAESRMFVPHAVGLGYTPSVPPIRRSWIEKGSVRIRFDVGDLRQEGTDESDDHYLILPTRPPDGVLHGTWKATVPDVYGVLTGTLDVPVAEEPVDLRNLLDNAPEPADLKDDDD
jgi:hypothetical protein